MQSKKNLALCKNHEKALSGAVSKVLSKFTDDVDDAESGDSDFDTPVPRAPPPSRKR